MKIKIFQKGFNYSQDGPGNRLVYHMYGCNMLCPWCANPEGIYDSSYSEYELKEITDEVIKSAMLFFDGGGVTFTGGEPTVQFDSLQQILQKLCELNIHTAIETNGTHPRLPELFGLIDYLIMDFKHYNNAIHKDITGVGNEIIKENIKQAAGNGKKLLIRTPLINGFNSKEKDAIRFSDYFKDLNTQNVSFEFLKYHEFGKVKWEQLGMKYKLDKPFVDEKTIELFEKIFKKNNLNVIRT